MIIFRRIVAVLLALVFVILFFPLILVYRVNGTVGSPGFYVDQLRRADVYNFLYTDILPAALDSMESDISGFDLSWAKPQVLAIAKQTAPPDWLQAQTEQVITAIVPYVVGDTRTFTVVIPLRERVPACASAVKSTLHQEGVMTRLYDQAIDSVVTNVAVGLPLPFTVADMNSAVRTVLPPDWVLKQTDGAIDEVVPYFTKDKEHFTIRVNLLERQDSIRTALTDILNKTDAYDYFVREFVTRLIMPNLRQAEQAGVPLASGEVIPAVKQAIPLNWYQTQVPGIADQVFAYISGTQQTLGINISIADRKPAIADALGFLIAQKLKIQSDSLPAAWKNLVNTIIASGLPDRITLTEAQLVGSTGGDNPFAQARKYLQQGISFTDQDLRNKIGASHSDDIRQWLSAGFTFSEKDFNSWIKGEGGSGASDFDSVRVTMGTARRWLGFAWLVPALLLVAIGFLGGRRWSSRLIWAAAVLAVAALVVLIVFGPVFSAAAQPAINTALTPPAGLGVLEGMLASKGAGLALNAIGTFVNGLKIQAIILLIVALALIVVGAIWHGRRIED